jgi:acetyl-CoA carboxylase carboxyl transferase subunit beta
MLGDIQIAEPGAQIGFTGARVIAQTIREKLPEGFQRAEYLLEHGMLDMVVPRKDMRATLSRVVHMLMKQAKPKSKILPMPKRGNGNGGVAATS